MTETVSCKQKSNTDLKPEKKAKQKWSDFQSSLDSELEKISA